MLEDSAFELTLDESELLIVAAKLFAVAREYSVRPPQSEHEVNYWNEKVKEELVHFLPVSCIFGLILSFIRVPLTVSMADMNLMNHVSILLPKCLAKNGLKHKTWTAPSAGMESRFLLSLRGASSSVTGWRRRGGTPTLAAMIYLHIWMRSLQSIFGGAILFLLRLSQVKMVCDRFLFDV